MRRTLTAAFLAALLVMPTAARAGIPVIDVTAIIQLIQQLTYWQQQLGAMGRQLNQLQQTHAGMTGQRGMHAVLPITPQQRNYLPMDHAELMQAVNGMSAPYAGLTGRIEAAMAANAVLTNAQLRTLTPEMRQIVEQGRRSTAMLAQLTQTAYRTTSDRFATLQQLVNLIAGAGDLKAIQDLQARVNTEQVLLTNEQTKLQTLYHMAQADQLVHQQRLRERVVAGHGGFQSRFAPSP